MRCTSLVLLTTVLLVGAPRSAHAQKLVAAKIVFDTYSPGGDDKDHDTKVTVKLHTKEKVGGEYNRLVAQRENFDGDKKYDDPSKHEKELDLQGTMTRADIDGLRVHIHIEPNGHDTWKFHYKVQLKFDDGSVLEKGEDGVKLTQGAKTHEKSF